MRFSLNRYSFVLCLICLLFVAASCDFEDVGGDTKKDPDKEKPGPDGGSNTPADSANGVPADGVMEATTWNLEWYGSTRNGPDDEEQQTKNIVAVIDTMNADLFAFEEVYNQDDFNNIVTRTKGYHGFTSHFNTYDDDDTHTGFSQQTAFLFNTNAIDSVSSGLIKDGQDYNAWASGRYPFYFRFNYKYQNQSVPVFAIVIHAKANYGSSEDKRDSYKRRRKAANELHSYLQSSDFRQAHPDAQNIIIMGDFNDDTDVSIYDNSSPSPYKVFVDDSTDYAIITKPITAKNKSSYLGGDYSDLIDQIFVSDDLNTYYRANSIEIFQKAQNVVNDYENSTSDHLPVWAKFDMIQ